MRWLRFAFRVLAWDGILPVVATFLPRLLIWLLPLGDKWASHVILIIPFCVLGFRAVAGMNQLERRYDKNVPRWRSRAFFGALLFLVLFEVTVNMVFGVGPLPPKLLPVLAVAFYLPYLAIISVAMAPVFLEPVPAKESMAE